MRRISKSVEKIINKINPEKKTNAFVAKSNNEIINLEEKIEQLELEIERSEDSKNDFVVSMAHELRTPLTAIKGWAETMKMGSSIEHSTLCRGLEIIANESDRLALIVNEISNYFKFKRENANTSQNIDILKEIDEIVFLFEERALNENKTLSYNKPPETIQILGNKNGLRQVFMNLIDNAFKFTSNGMSISVSVNFKNDIMYAEITDNGCGIPKQHLPKIKQKFFRGNSAVVGSGIGLAIAQEIVSAHNGTMEILSEENFGTTVIVSFPIPTLAT
jgi:signal transduction histidine kinase